jgi:hypothetical protein
MNKLIFLLFLINIIQSFSYNLSLIPFINKILNLNREKMRIKQYNSYIVNRIILDKKVDKIVGKKNFTK